MDLEEQHSELNKLVKSVMERTVFEHLVVNNRIAITVYRDHDGDKIEQLVVASLDDVIQTVLLVTVEKENPLISAGVIDHDYWLTTIADFKGRGAVVSNGLDATRAH